MSLSMYQVTVSPMTQLLNALSKNLRKAKEHCAINRVDEDNVLLGRLAPDMMTLIEQVQRASFNAVGAVARLAQAELPEFADDEKTFDDLQKRIADTLSYMAGYTEEQLKGSEMREVEVQTRVALLKFDGQDYLLQFALPQVLFHVTTAHGIMRNQGVDIGKRDFLGKMDVK
mgnify:CR=1 FL=1